MKFFSAWLAFLFLLALGGVSIFPARAGDASPPASAPVPTALRLLRDKNPLYQTLPQARTSGAQAGLVPSPVGLAPTDGCGYNADTQELLLYFSSSEWLNQVRFLSGAEPVVIAGETYTITTRYTPRLFDGSDNARAYDYLLEQLLLLHYPGSTIEQDPWTGGGGSGFNLVLTIPGQITPTEVVALTAHLDSLSPQATRDTLAPGAEDNASGSAALLEAARLLRHYQFERSVKLIWFTGEEQGLLGSTSYVDDYDVGGYEGVVNLDMFGYDADNDRCIELHVGTLAASNTVGQCFAESVAAYNLDLRYDYLTSSYTSASDHYPFWQRGVGAVLVHQNGNLTAFGGCNALRDRNPFYHTINDTVANSFPPYTNGQPNMVGADISRAGLAAVAGMAGNRGTCFDEAPWVTVHYSGGVAYVSWTSLPGAAGYRLYRQVENGYVVELNFGGSVTEWTDTHVVVGFDHHYRVEAVAADGVCLSPAGQTALIWVIHPQAYLPMVKK